MATNQKWITVKDMCEYTEDNGLYLLSQFNADFWSAYRSNHVTYDRTFKRLFKNYRYFNQDIEDEDLNVEDVTNEFIDEVYHHLMLHKKKYEELARVNGLESYDIFANIEYTETRATSGSNTGSNVYGTRSDSSSTKLGKRTDTDTQQVSAFNESTYTNANKVTSEKGEETDTNSFTKGEQTDTVTGSNTENVTISRDGKTNSQSNTELLTQFDEYWSAYMDLYVTIFTDIAEALLLI